jgi:hypothetical protein
MVQDHVVIGADTVRIDLTTGITQVQVKQSEQSLDSLWQQVYAGYHSPWVCVSGGADSQLTANLAHLYSETPQAVTFAFVWEHTVVNAPDVVQATRFCKNLGMPHQIIDVDLKDFLNNHLHQIAQEYQCVTPQLASHLWAMKLHLSQSGNPVLYGGEAPYVHVNDQGLPVPAGRSSFNKKSMSKFFKEMMLPFYLFGKIHDVQINRDPFTVSPEIYFQSLMHNIQVWRNDNLQLPEVIPPTLNGLPFKHAYYQALGYHTEFPLSKKTGFELLKSHLAQQTGNYDEFDLRYRKPLRDLLKTGEVHGNASWQSLVEYHGDVDLLFDQLARELSDCLPSLKPGTQYNFDW